MFTCVPNFSNFRVYLSISLTPSTFPAMSGSQRETRKEISSTQGIEPTIKLFYQTSQRWQAIFYLN